VTNLIARFRSFRTPRHSTILLLAGLAFSFLARRIPLANTQQHATAIATLDRAIAAAVPASGDTSEASFARVKQLVSQRRDAAVNVQRSIQGRLYWLVAGSVLVFGAVVTGALALLGHLRDDALSDIELRKR
jgi:hypothetical protein